MHTMHLILASSLTAAICSGVTPCSAADAPELPKTGFALEARVPVETIFFALVSYGGGALVGYRFPRTLVGLGAEFVELYVPDSPDPSPRYVPTKHHQISVTPTIQYAIGRSDSRMFEFCIGAELPITLHRDRRYGTNIDGLVDKTSYYVRPGFRFSLGPRYWMSPHIAISFPISLGVLMLERVVVPTLGMTPALMGVF